MERISLATSPAHAVTATVAALKESKVICVPTDTVYGFICPAFDSAAVDRLFAMKERPATQPVGLFVKDIAQAKELVDISPRYEEIVTQHWPGAVTFVLPKLSSVHVSHKVSDGKAIGLRQPDSSFLQQVLELFGQPLAQTSANVSGGSDILSDIEVIRQFECREQPDVLVEAGELPHVASSTVVDMTQDPPHILRQGDVTIEL